MVNNELRRVKYKELVEQHFGSSGKDERFMQEAVRRMRLDGMQRFPTFAFEDFPKEFGREVDYYIDNYTIISRRNGFELVYEDENNSLFYKKYDNKIILELRDRNGETLSYRIMFK